jgi:hypothetical protein
MQLTLAMLLLLIFPSAQEGLGNIGNPSDPTRQGLGALMIIFFMFGAARWFYSRDFSTRRRPHRS